MLRKITFSTGLGLMLMSAIVATNASTKIVSILATSPTATPMPEPIMSPTPMPPSNPAPTGSPIASPPGDDPTYPKEPKPVTSPTL